MKRNETGQVAAERTTLYSYAQQERGSCRSGVLGTVEMFKFGDTQEDAMSDAGDIEVDQLELVRKEYKALARKFQESESQRTQVAEQVGTLRKRVVAQMTAIGTLVKPVFDLDQQYFGGRFQETLDKDGMSDPLDEARIAKEVAQALHTELSGSSAFAESPVLRDQIANVVGALESLRDCAHLVQKDGLQAVGLPESSSADCEAYDLPDNDPVQCLSDCAHLLTDIERVIHKTGGQFHALQHMLLESDDVRTNAEEELDRFKTNPDDIAALAREETERLQEELQALQAEMEAMPQPGSGKQSVDTDILHERIKQLESYLEGERSQHEADRAEMRGLAAAIHERGSGMNGGESLIRALEKLEAALSENADVSEVAGATETVLFQMAQIVTNHVEEAERGQVGADEHLKEQFVQLMRRKEHYKECYKTEKAEAEALNDRLQKERAHYEDQQIERVTADEEQRNELEQQLEILQAKLLTLEKESQEAAVDATREQDKQQERIADLEQALHNDRKQTQSELQTAENDLQEERILSHKLETEIATLKRNLVEQTDGATTSQQEAEKQQVELSHSLKEAEEQVREREQTIAQKEKELLEVQEKHEALTELHEQAQLDIKRQKDAYDQLRADTAIDKEQYEEETKKGFSDKEKQLQELVKQVAVEKERTVTAEAERDMAEEETQTAKGLYQAEQLALKNIDRERVTESEEYAEQIQDLNKRLEETSETINKLEQERDTMANSLEDVRKQTDVRLAEVGSAGQHMQQELEALKEAHVGEVAQLEQSLAERDETLSVLQQRYQERETETAALRTRGDEFAQEIGKRDMEREHQLAECDRLRAENRSIQSAHDDMRELLGDAQRALEKEQSSHKVDESDAQSTVKDLQEMLIVVRKDCEILRQDKKEIQQELDRECEAKSKEESSLEKERRRLRKELKECVEENKILKGVVADKNKRLDTMDELERNVLMVKGRNEQLEEQRDEVKHTYEDACKELEGRLLASEAALQSREESIHAAHVQITTLQKDLEKEQSAIQKLERHLELAQSNLRESEEKENQRRSLTENLQEELKSERKAREELIRAQTAQDVVEPVPENSPSLTALEEEIANLKSLLRIARDKVKESLGLFSEQEQNYTKIIDELQEKLVDK